MGNNRSKISRRKLATLIRDAWDVFVEIKRKSNVRRVVVKNSIPILWFGKLFGKNSYETSATRIVTVGLNPSNEEFSKSECRFPAAANLNNNRELSDEDITAYEEALNAYFTTNPYKDWFGHVGGGDDGENVTRLERLLEGIHATYYPTDEKSTNGNCKNTAIHIDVGTFIATNPTWSKLNKGREYREIFQKVRSASVPIFKKLLELLSPDLVLISTNSELRDEIFAKEVENEGYLFGEKWEITKDGDKRKIVLASKIFKSGYRVVWGSQSRKPFNNCARTYCKKIEGLLHSHTSKGTLISTRNIEGWSPL